MEGVFSEYLGFLGAEEGLVDFYFLSFCFCYDLLFLC